MNDLKNDLGKYDDQCGQGVQLGRWLMKCQKNVVACLFNLKKKIPPTFIFYKLRKRHHFDKLGKQT